MKNRSSEIREAIRKAAVALWGSTPVLLGAVLLISLSNALIPKSAYAMLFNRIGILDSLAGSAVGSVLAGNPLTSYILGGEFLSQGISLVAVTAFIVAWVTVGIVQLPAESIMLGKRFAIIRNTTAFVMAMLVAVVTVVILNLI